MDFATALLGKALGQTLLSLSHNWPYLLASILVAAGLTAFVDTATVAAFLGRHRRGGVLVATGAAVATPFCSCGTTAVVLGMMASTMPLAPIVAFMVASPLSSPEELLYSAGLFGWPFALAYFGASILLGLGGGGLAAFLERRGHLAGQARMAGTHGTAFAPGKGATTCGCSAAPTATPTPAVVFLKSILATAKRLLPLFVGFAFVGYVLNGLIPASWIGALFGKGQVYSVPLAATIGLPLYVSSEASLPLVRALQDSGMSPGAIMAFLIAGSGTSLGAVTGALTIARWKVVALVVAVLWVGAILAGYAFDALSGVGIV